MKKILTLFAVVGLIVFSSCEGPEGPPGQDGANGPKGDPGFVSEVFELQNINFSYNKTDGYNIYQKLNPVIYNSDVILIYRLAGTVNPTTPIWQQIPRTLYTSKGELDYDFDFSKEDFTIYAGGNYDLALTPEFLNKQTFRIVIIPGAFSTTGKSANKPDYSDYNAVIKKYNIDDSNVKKLN
nr:collagen-like protein [Flavobacterium sp. ASV13]